MSKWRGRPVARGLHVPFPRPVQGVHGGHELFALAEVVEWLEASGRGNNADFRRDALAHARPLVDLDEDTTRAALEALLCLKARVGLTLSGLRADAIVQEADALDPDDNHLVSELMAAGDALTDLASYAERLSDALWDAASAYVRVRAAVRETRPALGREALRLLGLIGAAVALESEGDVVVGDPNASDVDWLDALLTALGEDVDAHVLVVGDSARHRAARRLHSVRGRSVVDAAPVGVLPLVVTRIPGWGYSTDPSTLLTQADDVQLDLHEEQRALVVGPATVLCDGLGRRDLDQQRDHFIRLGRLRCALRLPGGLLNDGSRTALGLWVLGGEPASVRVEYRRLATADLSNEALTPDAIEDLVTDVVASLTDSSRHTHAFRYARLHATAALLAGSGPIVVPGTGPAPIKVTPPAESVVSVRRILSELQGESSAPVLLEGLEVGPGADTVLTSQVSIDAAIREGLLRVLPGSRIAQASSAASGVRIIDPQDVQGIAQPPRLVDPLDLEELAPRARRTEAGDVVFCVSPRPAAIVDTEGLSVVASPARVLRCAPGSGLVPEAVAQAINSRPPRSPRWRAWRIPRVPVAQADSLAAVLRAVAAEEERARARGDRLALLAHELARGVSTGALTITDHSEEGP
ncbi:hypothetical protein IGS73_06245 [Janibacter indicus]|uniref:DNA methylase adenine-specific domain-containing protein n=1 Tax=Janibacter indicus TaxID=857417 RepID=A0A7L9J4L8_9MICO|nr:hypothetical protein [Janibacter indicus]QOK23973.1 hypothetical protein IGS73_06245 [Janibacter indicus]